ncbi:MAG: helix-turn-helix transcriptional regulator, partial [Spirochaetales bacterium]|nr:helix-turn-helix transcriptional regulator [Spirochaetales bacterium]
MDTTKSQLLEVASRIREMREIMGFSQNTMAQKTNLELAEYKAYESGEADLPFSFIHKCALAFGIDITDLLEGHSTRLSSYTV